MREMIYFTSFLLTCLLSLNAVSQKIYDKEDCKGDEEIRRVFSDLSTSMSEFMEVVDKRLGALESRVCESKWAYFHQSCYFLSTDELTWYKAQQKCSQYGSVLVEIESQEENDFVERFLERRRGNVDIYPWIGASDMAVEGNFVWNSTGQPLTFTSWRKGEPNDQNNEDCVFIYANGIQNGLWNDVPCTMNTTHICEMKITEISQI